MGLSQTTGSVGIDGRSSSLGLLQGCHRRWKVGRTRSGLCRSQHPSRSSIHLTHLASKIPGLSWIKSDASFNSPSLSSRSGATNLDNLPNARSNSTSIVLTTAILHSIIALTIAFFPCSNISLLVIREMHSALTHLDSNAFCKPTTCLLK